MTPQERYDRDAQFRMLVDILHDQIRQAHYAPTEIREAAMLAAIHYDAYTVRRHIVPGLGNSL